jgi:glycosyltransferase involved in cell wall biosynthesis
MVLNFSWRTALLARYDVFHVHWPEILVSGQSPLKKLVRQALTVALLARLRLTGTPIVRTVHNLERPRGISRRESFLLDRVDRQTALRIRLNDASDVVPGQSVLTIPHGHYRDWFARYPHAATVDGQLGYVGQIRHYKGVEGLLEAFNGIRDLDDDLSLRIGGKPSHLELAQTMRTLAGDDERIVLELNFLSDAELVDIVTSSELVVLPYRFMHNSGAALAALSLDRPILVPDNLVNRNLAAEVGDGWIYRFEGDLTGEQIAKTLAELRSLPDHDTPDLSARGWDRTGIDYLSAYRSAIALLHKSHRP